MNDKTCDLLSEADNLFTKGIVNERKFNSFTKCHSYCPYQNNSKKNKCTNDYERINALGSYLFNEISEINKDFKGATGDKRHIEVFMMWLGDKLFKIENDYKATLEDYYKNHLEKHMGNFNYWDAIDSKKLYKKATIKKMNELYNLLSHICKLIIEYYKNIQNPKNHDRKRLGNYSAQCVSHYRAIISSANGCKPYLQLLDSLKMIYENFRMYKIDHNNSIKAKEKDLLLKRIQHLTTFKDVNRYLLGINPILSFDDKECKDVKSEDEKIGKSIASKGSQDPGKSKNHIRGIQTRVSGKVQRGNPGSPQPKQPPVQLTTLKLPPAPRVQPQPEPVEPVPPQKPGPPPGPPSTSSQKDTKLKTPQAGEIHQNGPGGPGDGKRGPGNAQVGSDNRTGISGDGSGGTDAEKKDINRGLGSHGGSGTPVGTDGGQRSPNSGTGDSFNGPGGGKGSGVHGSGGVGVKSGDQAVKDSQEGIGGGTSGGKGIPSSGASGGQGSQRITNSESGGAGGGPDASKIGQKTSDGDKGNKDDGTNDGTGTTGSGANGGGSTQGDQGNPNGGSSDPASNTLGGSFDLWSPFRGFLLNGTEIYNKTFQFIKDNQKMFKDAAEKINDAYNDTVENLKNVYNVSSSYFNGIINNITNQLNQVGAPSKSGGNHPGSGSPLSGGNSSNQSPSSPPKDPQPQTPPINPPSPIPAVNQPPPTPQQPQPLNPKQNKQSSFQSQHITQNPAQLDPPNHKANTQLVKLPNFNLNLKKPWNIFPTTWNGSGDCKSEIKFMNTTLVCCTSEQCSLTGISVILVLIPIILLIAYKYLSFGLSKKSEKKNMKRVINFHDGNRKTKIIISSCDKKKDLKPVINSVGGKKYSLLNMYKLIRADPMPFINLFFLLIFFVYKRKRDTIE